MDTIDEALTLTQIDYLIRLGLGDPAKLNWYRQVLVRPEAAVTNPALRPYAAVVLTRLLKIISSDPMMLARLKVILQRDYEDKERLAEEATPEPPFTTSRLRRALGGNT